MRGYALDGQAGISALGVLGIFNKAGISISVQTTAEGTPFSGSMNTMALCDFDMRRLRRTLSYLLTYLGE